MRLVSCRTTAPPFHVKAKGGVRRRVVPAPEPEARPQAARVEEAVDRADDRALAVRVGKPLKLGGQRPDARLGERLGTHELANPVGAVAEPDPARLPAAHREREL